MGPNVRFMRLLYISCFSSRDKFERITVFVCRCDVLGLGGQTHKYIDLAILECLKISIKIKSGD